MSVSLKGSFFIFLLRKLLDVTYIFPDARCWCFWTLCLYVGMCVTVFQSEKISSTQQQAQSTYKERPNFTVGSLKVAHRQLTTVLLPLLYIHIKWAIPEYSVHFACIQYFSVTVLYLLFLFFRHVCLLLCRLILTFVLLLSATVCRCAVVRSLQGAVANLGEGCRVLQGPPQERCLCQDGRFS